MSNNIATIMGPQAPLKIEWRGKVFTLSFLTQKVKAELSNWILQNKIKVLTDFKPLLTPEQYSGRVEKLMDEWDAGKYGFLSQKWLEEIQTTEGVVQLAKAMFSAGGTDITEDELLLLMAEKGDEFRILFDVIVTQSMPPKG